MGHCCRTLRWVTVVGHSHGTILWDTLGAHTLVGHSCGSLLRDTLDSCRRLLLWDTLMGHSCCGTLLWDTRLLGHSRTLLWDALVAHQRHAVFIPACFALPRGTAHRNPRTRQSQCHSDIHLYYHNSELTTSRFPVPATKLSASTSNAHKVRRLPRKVTISYHVSFNKAPHHTFGMASTRSEHTPIHQNRHFS